MRLPSRSSGAWWRRSCGAASAALLLACSEAASEEAGPATATGAASGGGGAGAAGGSGGSAATPTHLGTVVASSGTYDGSDEASVLALFYELAEPAPCAEQEVGPCTVRSCSTGGRVTQRSAGTIVIGGGLQDPITATPDAGNDYQSDVDAAALLFAGGEALSFSASGGDVPAFAATVTAPATATLVSPVGTMVTVDTSADLAVAWQGGSRQILLTLAGSSDPGSIDTVSCTFAASDGSGAVPVAALSVLAGKSGNVSLRTRDAATPRVGPWQLEVSAESYARTGAGARAILPATFE